MQSINRQFFFDSVRLTLFDGALEPDQLQGLTSILNYWENNYASYDDRWLAYVLGTVHHEVDRQMQPIREYGSVDKFFKLYDLNGDRPSVAKLLGNVVEGDGALFCGRGFVQITGRKNYTDWGERLNTDLTSDSAHADRVLNLENAMRILFEGMIFGTFTGQKLSDFFNETKQDWDGARQIVNGTDRMALVASYAKDYASAISDAKA